MCYVFLIGIVSEKKTSLYLYRANEKNQDELLVQKSFNSPLYPSLLSMTRSFLKEYYKGVIRIAYFGFPISPQKSSLEIKELSWYPDELEFETSLNIQKTVFGSKFEACAYGLRHTGRYQLRELTERIKPRPHGTKIFVHVGDVLEETCVLDDGRDIHVINTQGSQTDFLPRNDVEKELVKFLISKFQIVSVSIERILSKDGLRNTYAYLKQADNFLEDKSVTESLNSSTDLFRSFFECAEEKSDILCERSLEIFLRSLGEEVANFSLTVVPHGGVFIMGGIPLEYCEKAKESFMKGFFGNEKRKLILNTVPVYVAQSEEAVLLGARFLARVEISKSYSPEKPKNRNTKSWQSSMLVLGAVGFGLTVAFTLALLTKKRGYDRGE